MPETALSTTLTRSEGGQCIGCTPSSPTSTNVMPITVKFNGPAKGIVTWAGINTPIERFNFALGNEHQKLLGEWALVEDSPRFPVYFGDRLIFAEIKEDGKLWGSITGAPNRPIIVTRQDALGYQYSAMLDSSSDYYSFFAFSFAGFNKIKGITSVSLKTDTVEQWVEDLSTGMPFIGYREKGATEVNAVMASVKSSAPDAVRVDQDAINAQKAALLRVPAGISEKSSSRMDERLLKVIQDLNVQLTH